MLSFQGVFDGKTIKFHEKVRITSPKQVIVTFLDDSDEEVPEDEILYLAGEGGAFDFLINDDEDIYSDSDLRIKY